MGDDLQRVFRRALADVFDLAVEGRIRAQVLKDLRPLLKGQAEGVGPVHQGMPGRGGDGQVAQAVVDDVDVHLLGQLPDELRTLVAQAVGVVLARLLGDGDLLVEFGDAGQKLVDLGDFGGDDVIGPVLQALQVALHGLHGADQVGGVSQQRRPGARVLGVGRQGLPVGPERGQGGIDPVGARLVQDHLHVLQVLVEGLPARLIRALVQVLRLDELVEIANDLDCVDARAELARGVADVVAVLQAHGLPAVARGVGV